GRQRIVMGMAKRTEKRPRMVRIQLTLVLTQQPLLQEILRMRLGRCWTVMETVMTTARIRIH
ncbi:MAG: hypothetical protein ACK5XN_27915, partial [Bacteroidota bacterium]